MNEYPRLTDPSLRDRNHGRITGVDATVIGYEHDVAQAKLEYRRTQWLLFFGIGAWFPGTLADRGACFIGLTSDALLVGGGQRSDQTEFAWRHSYARGDVALAFSGDIGWWTLTLDGRRLSLREHAAGVVAGWMQADAANG